MALVELTHSGTKFAEITTPDGSVTLNTKDKTVKDYIKVQANVPQPTGKKEITSTAETDVANYATAQVIDSDLIAGNIKKNVNILGVTGTFETPLNPLNVTTLGTFSPASGTGYGTVTVQDSDCVAGNIKSGVNILGVTGTLVSKNNQISAASKRIASTTITATGSSLTVSKSGTYNIHWMHAASSSNSNNYSKYYVNGSCKGSNVAAPAISNTTANAYTVSVNSVALNQGDVVDVRARVRATSNYIIAGHLSIEEV